MGDSYNDCVQGAYAILDTVHRAERKFSRTECMKPKLLIYIGEKQYKDLAAIAPCLHSINASSVTFDVDMAGHRLLGHPCIEVFEKDYLAIYLADGAITSE